MQMLIEKLIGEGGDVNTVNDENPEMVQQQVAFTWRSWVVMFDPDKSLEY
jgi:hypothetical protein